MLSEKMEKIWNKFSDEEKKTIEARYKDLHAEYMTLQEIRKHRNITQEDLAKLLGINQENVSRMERREDMMISTLRSTVEAMGGELEITVRFPGREPVFLEGLGRE